ncbi:hypothetical protein [Leucothrix arctica]|uniref:Uncharacterized protein n=1 Tax=Leucothrix arctica TaxID=1481894 RepID=A0A317C5L4_9GAMM|nr:hypothetical protein [Leucothrix arctica]PWQ93908.1 hypothetical protein DKT75_20115 [Leucothrix arctica]
MIDQSQQNSALRVCLEDVGTHNRAVLDFFFAKLGQHTFRCVDSQVEANVLIIDYDFPPARQRYESEYQEWQKPAIILSISEVSLDNVIWLPKPLTSRSLLDAAASVRALLKVDVSDEAIEKLSNQKIAKNIESFVAEKPVSLQRPVIKKAEVLVSVPLVNKAEVVEETKAVDYDTQSVKQSPVNLPVEKNVEPSMPVKTSLTDQQQAQRWVELCGDLPDFDVSANLVSMQAEESFFISSVKDAVRLARQCQQGVLLNFPQAKIFVLPEIHRIFCTVSIDGPDFIALIRDCNSGDGGKMHILSTPEIHELNELISNQSTSLYDLESFVWTSALLSAHGLLPRDLDPNKVVGLKHWPSMTRVALFPHIMPIAAQWAAQGMNAFDVAKTLNVPQRYVFSFYNAANTLGLIEMDPEKLIKKQSTTRKAEAPRGLFSRLLKRLVGG